jgi:hypothetical protein
MEKGSVNEQKLIVTQKETIENLEICVKNKQFRSIRGKLCGHFVYELDSLNRPINSQFVYCLHLLIEI